MAMQEAVSKGEFAAMIGVSPGRVSQYLTEGKITAAALVGQGRNAKIHVERAKSELRLTLDIGQRLGNGINTNIEAGQTAPAALAHAPLAYDSEQPRGTDHEIKLQKLEQLRRANRNAAVAEAERLALLTDVAAAKSEMGRIASALLDVFEGGINDMAMAVAAQFQLPQRDVKHILRGAFRTVRETAARQMREKAIALPDMTQTVLEAEETEQSAVT
jgi:hypothetical protein